MAAITIDSYVSTAKWFSNMTNWINTKGDEMMKKLRPLQNTFLSFFL
jgi:hypothetical protein